MPQTNRARFVYVARAGNSDFYKIGKTDDLHERISGLTFDGRMYHARRLGMTFEEFFPVGIVWVYECGAAKPKLMHMEKVLHLQFEPNRVSGEWFRFSRHEIRRLRREGVRIYNRYLKKMVSTANVYRMERPTVKGKAKR